MGNITITRKTTRHKDTSPKAPKPSQPASQPSPQNCHPANPKPNTTSSSEKPEPIIIKSKIKINIRIKQIHRRRPRLIALKMIQNLQKPHPQKVPSAGKYLPEKKNRSGR